MVLIFATLTVVSCSKDEVVDAPSVNDTDTYSAVSISFPKTLTLRNADPDAANTMESTVNTIGVYIIDEFNGFMHKGVFGSTDFTQVSDDMYRLTSAVKTTTGNKSVYVVLNPTAELQDAIELQKGGIFGDNPFNGTAEPTFVSASDIVMASVAGKTTTLSIQTATEALDAPLAISVQRNTAKVAVKKKATTIPVVGGSINYPEFALVVEAKKSYLIQQGGNTYETVKTPAQNIDNLLPENDYFTKLATPYDWKSINENTVPNNNLDGYYALENVNTKKLAGNTTAAIIKVQFTPAANSVVIDYAPDGTRTMGSIGSGTSFYVKKSDNTFWDESAFQDAIANNFTPEHFSKLYEDGICYYRIWVQDANNQKGVLRNNFYVFNINKITGPGLPYVPGVNPDDITNPEDPNLPIDEDTNISVEVIVLPWNVENSDHEI
ncbi:MAG: Mfa1 family fimbria major subunit [Tannerella sp.]|jgi:hypothetical protein|nr:Mfa1 family fimbria major subunit [Tannerella sp.]